MSAADIYKRLSSRPESWDPEPKEGEGGSPAWAWALTDRQLTVYENDKNDVISLR